MTTWRKALLDEARDQGDSSPIVAYAPSEGSFDIEFDDGYGATEGAPVLAWSEERVYFPLCYDGSEWMGSAPRNPAPKGQNHQGGG